MSFSPHPPILDSKVLLRPVEEIGADEVYVILRLNQGATAKIHSECYEFMPTKGTNYLYYSKGAWSVLWVR